MSTTEEKLKAIHHAVNIMKIMRAKEQQKQIKNNMKLKEIDKTINTGEEILEQCKADCIIQAKLEGSL